MQINEYVQLTKNTLAKLESKQLDNFHALFGMTTEIGELIDQYKKNLAYGKKIDEINSQEEIGDIMYYIGAFCLINGFNLEAILENNIKKLATRYPNKFTEYHATHRDLEAERKVLEELEK
jgi:NTP pyrophosphatase (non-canonical NTP hydrolase)